MNINQKIVFRKYLCLLTLLILNQCITNPLQAQNTVSSNKTYSLNKNNFFYDLYEKHKNMPTKILIIQASTLCYTMLKIIGLVACVNQIKNMCEDLPLNKDERYFCLLFAMVSCLAGENIYYNLKDLYHEHLTSLENNPKDNSTEEAIITHVPEFSS